jgi:hypothetical protein
LDALKLVLLPQGLVVVTPFLVLEVLTQNFGVEELVVILTVVVGVAGGNTPPLTAVLQVNLVFAGIPSGVIAGLMSLNLVLIDPELSIISMMFGTTPVAPVLNGICDMVMPGVVVAAMTKFEATLSVPPKMRLRAILCIV